MMLENPALDMAKEVHAALVKEADEAIAEAAKHEIELTYQDFTVVDGELWIDGMDPKEWIEAMTMD